MESKIYEIENKYLAEGISYLGFRYFKTGHGKETIYTFEDTVEFRTALEGIKNLKIQVGKFS